MQAGGEGKLSNQGGGNGHSDNCIPVPVLVVLFSFFSAQASKVNDLFLHN